MHSQGYFCGLRLSKIYCPGGPTADSQRAQLGLSFTYVVKLTPEDSEKHGGSIQSWFNEVATSNGVESAGAGWCRNKPTIGTCPYQDLHQGRDWLLKLPVVWAIDAEEIQVCKNI